MPDSSLWITSAEASEIMTKIHGRPISQAQVRQLGRRKGPGSIRTKKLHERTNLYHRRDVEAARIARHETRPESERKPGRPRKQMEDISPKNEAA